MKVIVLGASGTIASEIVRALEPSHEIIRASRKRSDIVVDYFESESVHDMFKSAAEFDAVVAIVGGGSVFAPYDNAYRS